MLGAKVIAKKGFVEDGSVVLPRDRHTVASIRNDLRTNPVVGGVELASI